MTINELARALRPLAHAASAGDPFDVDLLCVGILLSAVMACIDDEQGEAVDGVLLRALAAEVGARVLTHRRHPPLNLQAPPTEDPSMAEQNPKPAGGSSGGGGGTNPGGTNPGGGGGTGGTTGGRPGGGGTSAPGGGSGGTTGGDR